MNLQNEFIKACKAIGKGTIVEFGTCTGYSADFIAQNWSKSNGEIFTIDGWLGLPKSDKIIPENWNEGAFKGDKEKVAEKLSKYNNITMIDSWINLLKEPVEYNIGKVVAANVDVDIYESTVDSLSWLDKCEWLNDEVIVRFDDWAHPSHNETVKYHNKLAYSEFIERTKYSSTTIASDQYCVVFKIKR